MLEVACGTGRFATFVKARSYVGGSEGQTQPQS
jgi:ubiquinone/menaquinone biosynthesis C-methylase UbiE